MPNAILVIHPYKSGGTWVFDDERYGLVREPFVLGASEMIDRSVAREGVADAERGVPRGAPGTAGPRRSA